MRGFGPLFRKELLEQRRTWRFLAMAIVFTLVAVLVPVIARIVIAATGETIRDDAPRNLLEAVGGGVIPSLGTFLAIIVAMGALAGERASGTAAMTLSKPVTRAALVLAKFLTTGVGILAALAFGSIIAYVLTLVLFGDGGAGRFALGSLISGVYLVFISTVTLFWSANFNRPLLAGGIAFASLIVMQTLQAIPHAGRYLPTNAADYGRTIIGGQTNDSWPALGVACGLIVILPVLAWLIFRQKEL